MRFLMTAAAAAFALGIAACSQGTNEEAGEQADTAIEQSTTGETNLGQGPMEEAGEHADEVQGEAAEGGSTTTPPSSGTTTTP
jgi:hypothetical protein